MTTLSPTSRGTTADQAVVPLAVPELPVDVDHRTAVTPTLSEALPAMEMLGDKAEAILEPGVVMDRDVGVVSLPPERGVGGGAGGAAGVWLGGAGTGVEGGCAGGCGAAVRLP